MAARVHMAELPCWLFHADRTTDPSLALYGAKWFPFENVLGANRKLEHSLVYVSAPVQKSP